MIEHMEGGRSFLPAALSEASGIGMTIQPSLCPLPKLNFYINVSDHFFLEKKAFFQSCNITPQITSQVTPQITPQNTPQITTKSPPNHPACTYCLS
jgi:hypothetical protein